MKRSANREMSKSQACVTNRGQNAEKTVTSDAKSETIEKLYSAFNPNNSAQDVVEYYNNWKNYEIDGSPEQYAGPLHTAKYAHKYLQGDTTKSIIDVGAGSGKVARELQSFAQYNNIDAIEPAAEFFRKSTNQRLYTTHYCEFGGSEPTSIQDDSYDIAVSCGSFMEGHIPCIGVTELLRIVKPGGFVIITMRKEYLDKVTEYRNRLEPYIEELQQHGKCEMLERATEPNHFCDMPGRVFVLKSLEVGFKEFESNVL